MGWAPQVRKHRRKGRRPWYTLTVGGREHHLGVSPETAYRKAAEILGAHGVSPQRPVNVAGLIRAWHETTGRPIYWLIRWGKHCRAMLWELGADDLQGYADALAKVGLSAHTVRKYVAQARLVWRWGVRQGWISEGPAKVVTAKPLIVPRDLDPKFVANAIKKLNPRAKAIARFILHVGCRPSEARRLRWAEVDLERGVCIVSGKVSAKTGLPRTIYLTREAEKIITRQPKNSEWVFTTFLGGPYTKDGLHSVLERVGIMNVYALRHTFAQWFLDHGGERGRPGDRAELSALLGHLDGRMVDVYAQVRDLRLRKRARRLTGPAG